MSTATYIEFSNILKCLIFLLKRLDSDIWKGEGLDYPEIVFDSIKDNLSYSALLSGLDPSVERPWVIAWYAEYLYTLGKHSAYKDVLPKMVGFMCGELQHERFHHLRPIFMVSATRVSSSTNLFGSC